MDASDQIDVAIIDDRPLIRDCFGRGLEVTDPTLSLRYFSGVDELRNADAQETECIGVVLICTSWSQSQSESCFVEISRLKAEMPSVSIIMLSDIEKVDDILRLIKMGARGYIPTSVSLRVAVKAIQLVAAGGVYVPASILFLADRIARQTSEIEKQPQPDSMFTLRQMSVIEALRRGKPNKIIAYDLNMCESTVKVHIRNIMKKMKARNRTEVAYLLNNMMSAEGVCLRD
ncbi:LuxR family transcriptional regulator [Aureimonas sp. SA4125]|uniref:response regulator transcription factor n=1 Tax=Aureimonas sp. SA4125 TaxID=2826993 RepID=UPI001CC37115|nr:response regulator transcription factor [Aureimonas sp. SA4125]BDA82971.1 LuxR family transcriptional regulator [Aureimonas sp. SA4125]